MKHAYRQLFAILLVMMTGSSALTAQTQFWKQMNIALNECIYAVLRTPQGVLFAGTEHGVYVSADSGTTWTVRIYGMPAGPSVSSLASDSRGTVYATVYAGNGSVKRSVYVLPAHDTVWQETKPGLGTLQINMLGSDQKNNFIYAGTNGKGAYRLADADTMWRRLDSTSLTDPHVTCFLADTTNGLTYAGTWSGIFRSADGGTTWSRLGTITNFIVYTMAINSKGHVFAGSSNYGVYRSTDNGQTWVEKNPMMMDSLATNIVVNANDVVFANTQGGIFKSTTNGDSWTPLAGNLQRTTFLGLDAGQYLYAGTRIGSLYRTKVSTTSGVHDSRTTTPATAHLENNYPNPFNPSTTISYDVQTTAQVTLTVCDYLGRHVATIVNRKTAPGHYEERFNAGALPSGIYFCRLQAGSYMAVTKMLLVK